MRETRAMRARTLAAVAAVAVLLPAPAHAVWPSVEPVAPTLPWTAYGFDDQLTNAVPGTDLGPANASTLGPAWQQQLDGPVFASPLYADGRLFVFTEAGSIYALDASTGNVLWRAETSSRDLGPDCGAWGVTSTGAIDAQRGVLYAISSDGALQALNIADGSSLPGWPVQVVDRPDVEYVWGGLRIVGDRLYVPVSSFCDGVDENGLYAEGSLLAVDLRTAEIVKQLDPVPGPDNGGGPWGYGGVSVEPDGSFLYAGFGNSAAVDPFCGCLSDTVGLGDSVARLTPDLDVVEYDRPPQIPAEGDFDFGSAPLLFQPDGCDPLAAANNKDGYMYVWRRHALFTGPTDAEPIGTVSGTFIAAPSWDAGQRLLLVAGARVLRGEENLGDGVVAFAVGADCRLRLAWQTVTGVGTQPPPVVLGDVVATVGGSKGGVYVLDAGTGKVLWSYATGPAFAPLIAVGDTIYAADGNGVVHAFALGAGAASR